MAKYPDITVQLSGNNGNAFAILSICGNAMINAGLPQAEYETFYKEATAGDYYHLLAVCIKWFEVE